MLASPLHRLGLWLPSPAAISHGTGRGWASVLSSRALSFPLSDALFQSFLEPLYTLKIVARSVLCVCVCFNLWKILNIHKSRENNISNPASITHGTYGQ